MASEFPSEALHDIRWEMVKPDDKVLSQKETREFLKISQNELDKIRKKKQLIYQVYKGCYFYSKADCVDWINKYQPGRLKKI